jgi:serine protease Do
LGQTTTAGIVSAKGRSIGIMRQNEGATAPLEHFIQTDAAINPGNSGGPLVDLRGRVVGVNSAIASPTGFYSGYGFAVPISLARRVSDDLIRYGVVHRPMLGVNVRTATPADAEVFRLPRPAGAVIAAETTGPAKEAGIRMGDVVIAVDGREVVDDGALTEHLARRRPGDRVVLDLIRYGVPERVTVRLSEMEVAPVERTAERNATRDPVARLGFEAMQVTPPVARQYRLPFTSGVMVTGVDRIGPAASALTPGMRVERLNGREIRSLDDMRAAARALSPGEVVSLVVRMQDDRQTIVNYRLR